MKDILAIEDRRLVLQTALDAAKTQAERNKMGQFATPTGLASDLLAFARHVLPPFASIRFLDPAMGTGAFYAALLREFREGQAERIETACGFEVDPHYALPTRSFWNDKILQIMAQDFTTSRPPSEDCAFNLIICNPPYVRHHHLDKTEKARLYSTAHRASGIRLAGLSGLYCYFLAIAHAWMAQDGIAGWLIPSEFMDVNYGVQIKHYLLNKVELLRVHRFDPNERQFEDALVSSSVVWFRNREPSAGHKVEFSYGGTLLEPSISRRIPLTDIEDCSKWTTLAQVGTRANRARPRLADYFVIKRGLATGSNAFFVLSRDQISSLNLPMEFFKPLLPGPRHLESDIIEANADGTPKLSRQLFVLDCRIPEALLKERCPTLWTYCQAGKPDVSRTYLCSRRNPWYAQEDRPPAPFVCTYMGRNIAKRDKPFRFILNQSMATATNVYLLLYPKPPLASAMSQNPGLAKRIWEFLQGMDKAALVGEGRVYGGGLYKMEPRELANVSAEALANLLPHTTHGPLVQGDLFANRSS